MKLWIKEPLLNQYETDLADVNQRIEYGILHVSETLAWFQDSPEWVTLDQVPGICIAEPQPPPLPRKPPPLPFAFDHEEIDSIDRTSSEAPTNIFAQTSTAHNPQHKVPAPTKSEIREPQTPVTKQAHLSQGSIFKRYKNWWSILFAFAFINASIYSIVSYAGPSLIAIQVVSSIMAIFGSAFIFTGTIWLFTLCRLRDKAFMITFTIMFFLAAAISLLSAVLRANSG